MCVCVQDSKDETTGELESGRPAKRPRVWKNSENQPGGKSLGRGGDGIKSPSTSVETGKHTQGADADVD